MRKIGKRALWLIGGAFFGAAAGRLYYANIDPPQERVPAQPLPSPNALDTYREAFTKLPRKLNPKSSRDISTLTVQQRTAALKEDARGLRLTRLALTQSLVFPRLRDFTTDPGFGDFANFRSLARLYVAEGETHLDSGDETGAMNSYLDTIATGQQQQSSGTMISRLVGEACQAIGRSAIWIRLDAWSGAAAKTGARRMEAIHAAYVPMSVNFTEEKAMGVSTLTVLLSDPKAAYAMLGKETKGEENPASTENQEREPGMMELYLRQQLGLFLFPKRDVMHNYRSYMDAIIAQAAIPYARRRMPSPNGDPFTGMLTPAYGESIFKDDSNRVQNALLTVALALRAYRADHGMYPTNGLQELCPTYLTDVPSDPFSADGKAPMLYRRTAEGYVLYSIGPDGKDDGGTPIENAGRPHGKHPRQGMTPASKGDIVAWENQF